MSIAWFTILRPSLPAPLNGNNPVPLSALPKARRQQVSSFTPSFQRNLGPPICVPNIGADGSTVYGWERQKIDRAPSWRSFAVVRPEIEGPFRSWSLSIRGESFPLLYRLIRRREDVEDLAQEVFLKVHVSLGSYDGRSPFGTWLGRITINHAYDYLRRQRTRQSEGEDAGAEFPQAAQGMNE